MNTLIKMVSILMEAYTSDITIEYRMYENSNLYGWFYSDDGGSHIFIDINAHLDEDDIGKAFLHTLAHEFRHAQQEYFGTRIANEEDAEDYAEAITMLYNDKTFKKLERYLKFISKLI